MKKRDQRRKREKKKSKSRFVNRGESVVIDFYPQGKSLSHRRSEDYNPLAVVVTVDRFEFFDIILIIESKVLVSDNLLLTPTNKKILRVNQLHFNQLSSSALKKLPVTIKNIVAKFESHYVTFLNQAHPLTTQMHQLQLLPGIGQKRLWSILEARKSKNFTSFSDFTGRTSISDPTSLFSNRILLELEGSQKYYLFIKKPQQHD